ncbi:o-succinylbenzoate synthase [Kineosporia sp. NBRC 101677]|uniref:o-succinylbenzoate synthase n=1 Tax=Kineosporia sp. NBRC 101677 TaxID=3032197 RepID=UPI0024A36EB5|nr:o-succinylbenzoate synthase [Kineosporia sp. NBRC 101677]GLY18593.1 o-succinylbenzoate synthase [Kineosporia sp. NBRC 101677]
MQAATDVQVVPYAIGMTDRFRGITVREGVLLSGPRGWGEFCPFPEYDDVVASRWLATAVEACTVGWPDPVREAIPVNCIVPAVPPERAAELVLASGCATAKVKVADRPDSLAEDVARVEAVRSALGPDGAIRVDANTRWDADQAVRALRHLIRAAGELEYAEQPCRTVEELAEVRRRVDVRIAADESIRQAADPTRVPLAEAADVAVIKCTPLGGVRRALEVAESTGLPCVVSSALETSIGLAAQVALAAALPELPFACGLGTVSLFVEDVVRPDDSLRPERGFIRVPASPPVPDPAALASVAMTDRARRDWWRARLARAVEGLPDPAGAPSAWRSA